MERDFDFKVALFDLDGVVVDTESAYTRFWAMIGREYVPDMPDFALRIKGMTLDAIYAGFFGGVDTAPITARLDEFERDMSYDDIPGIVPFLRQLKDRGVLTAVVTSSNMPKMRSFFSKRPDLRPLFDKVFTAEDFEAPKPDPFPYLFGAKSFGAEKKDCVIFEDSVNGLASARASGMYVVGLATTLPRDVVAQKCDEVIDNFEGISI